MLDARNMSVITNGIILTSENGNTPPPKKRGGLFAALFTTNPIDTGLGLNSGLHGERPVTNQLSCGSGNSPGTKSFLTECFIFGSPDSTE
jgi:hypothetical protein